MREVIAIMPKQNNVLMPPFDVLAKLSEHFLRQGKSVEPIRDGIRVTSSDDYHQVIEFRRVTIL